MSYHKVTFSLFTRKEMKPNIKIDRHGMSWGKTTSFNIFFSKHYSWHPSCVFLREGVFANCNGLQEVSCLPRLLCHRFLLLLRVQVLNLNALCLFFICSCANLLRFSAPISSPTRVEQPWLFQPEVVVVIVTIINDHWCIVIQCHFAYMGTPACKDCDGKRVYKSIDCQQRCVAELSPWLWK